MKRWISLTSTRTPSTRRCSTLSVSPWTISVSPSVCRTRRPSARPSSRCLPSPGTTLVVSRRSSRSSRRPSSILWITPRSFSSMVCRHQRASCSMVPLVRVRRCSPKPSPMSAKPTSLASRQVKDYFLISN